MDQKEHFYPNYFLECTKRPIIWFSLLFSYCHEQFTVQNSFVQGLYWFILLKLITVKDSQGTCNHRTKPNFHRTTAECASPALLHQEGNRVWGDLNWLPPALPHPELRSAYSGSRKLKSQNLEDGTRKKIKWQLDKLQLELSACRILVAQEIHLMPKEGQ